MLQPNFPATVLVRVFLSSKLQTAEFKSVVDRHRFDAYLDPDRHQNDADTYADPTPSFTHVENQNYLFFLLTRQYIEKYICLELSTMQFRPDPDPQHWNLEMKKSLLLRNT
jgi:hypothetical protein